MSEQPREIAQEIAGPCVLTGNLPPCNPHSSKQCPPCLTALRITTALEQVAAERDAYRQALKELKTVHEQADCKCACWFHIDAAIRRAT